MDSLACTVLNRGALTAALVPVSQEMVPVVDRVRRVLEISPPEGLIEATTSTAKLGKGRRDQPLRKHGKNADATERKRVVKAGKAEQEL